MYVCCSCIVVGVLCSVLYIVISILHCVSHPSSKEEPLCRLLEVKLQIKSINQSNVLKIKIRLWSTGTDPEINQAGGWLMHV